jgi:8-oxo-dGTP diphosphatase
VRAPAKRPGEKAWLAGYQPGEFGRFAVTVDLAIFSLVSGELCVLLVRRGGHPYKAFWALPGGHIRHGTESAEEAAARELAEETGVSASPYLEQLGTYSAPDRDPRIARGLHVVTVAFVALVPSPGDPVAGSDAAAAEWWSMDDLPPQLAFDHAGILADALERVRSKLEYTTLATRLVPATFTLADLRAVYAAVWGNAPDLANFRRKVLSTDGFVEESDEVAPPRAGEGGRPARLYRSGRAVHLDPPLRRITSPG